MIFNLPNILTILRIVLILPISILLFMPQGWAIGGALGLYTLACVTDWLDGYLSRKYKITSAFGRFLDPIADKILVAVLLLIFAATERLEGVWLIPTTLILFREILISGLREFLGPYKIIIHVSKLAKWKTTVQMIALWFLIAGDQIMPYGLAMGHWLLTLAALLTVITGYEYLQGGIKALQEIDKKDTP